MNAMGCVMNAMGCVSIAQLAGTHLGVHCDAHCL